MTGMGRTVQSRNPLIVSFFRSALGHQLLLVLAVLAVCAVAVNVVRTLQFRRLRQSGRTSFPSNLRPLGPEPAARRMLRIGFGCLWILDGLLQLQSSMPLGLPSACHPAGRGHARRAGCSTWSTAASPSGPTTRSRPPRRRSGSSSGSGSGCSWRPGAAGPGSAGRPVPAGDSSSGSSARPSAASSHPGLTWLFGAPGAVLFYCVAGVLIALPERVFATRRLGRIVSASGGVFLIGMAVLQAWPGRGFWQGGGRRHPARRMVRQMAQTPQPHFLSSWVGSFAASTPPRLGRQPLRRRGPGVPSARCLLSGRRRLVVVGARRPRRALPGRLGARRGLRVLRRRRDRPQLHAADGLALRGRLRGRGPAAGGGRAAAEVARRPDVRRRRPAAIPGGSASRLSYLTRTLAAVAAVGIVLVGTAPMALAAVNPNADPILTEASTGRRTPRHPGAAVLARRPARPAPVSLASLRGPCGRADLPRPRLHLDCPLIAQEFRQTDQQLGRPGHARRLRRHRGQPDLPLGWPSPSLRPTGGPHRRGQLVLPDRVAARSSSRSGTPTGERRAPSAPGPWSPTATWPSSSTHGGTSGTR